MGLGNIGGTPASPLAGGLPPLVDLDRWLAAWRGLPVCPVTRSDPEPRDPMHVETALRAVEDRVVKLALEVGLHLQELKPQHLA
jgi:hypothetical protein